MLFLAVFCGFLAEYQLEHVIENKREKQLVKSLLNDLRLDTAWLITVTNSVKSRQLNIDSAIAVLAQAEDNEIPIKVYQQLLRSTGQIMFTPHNGTITQLKSSGGMRLISKRSAVDSIEKYDRLIRRLEIRREITNQKSHDFITVLNKALDAKDLLKVYYDSVFYKKSIAHGQAIKLNNQYTNELINEGISMRVRTGVDVDANNYTIISALNLMEFLKKEYHLK